MKKLLLIFLLANVFNLNSLKAQNLIASGKIGFAYASGSLDSEIGVITTVSVENKFNKLFSLGINGKFGGTEYTDSKSTWEDNVLISERELNVNNTVYAVNIFPKISFVTTDDIILSFIPEVGYYWMQSRPVIYFTNKLNAEVTHTDYSSRLKKELSLGLHFEGQYYLTDKLNVLASIGWNNYNIGITMNNADLQGEWPSELNEKTFYLYFEVGITYTLFGKNYLE